MARKSTTPKSKTRSKTRAKTADKDYDPKTRDDEDDTHEGHGGIGGHCNQPLMPERPMEAGIDPYRMRLVWRNSLKWVNHTVLKYCFLDQPARWRGSNADKDVVRAAFQEWKDLPIGIEFRETRDPREAEFRIGFYHSNTAPDAGSWSYVGRDCIDRVPDHRQRTMNFGWDLTTPYGYDTALHEIGHALGFPHEHQNPNSGIVWDEDAVYAYFTGPPNNWTRDQTHWNVLRKLSQSEVDGSDWDPDSIMHYQFGRGLILDPSDYKNADLIPDPGLSQRDKDTAMRLYPATERVEFPPLRPYEAHQIRIGAGEQLDFVIEPDFTRDYTIQTFGQMDTVMVLFEEINGEPEFVDGDDDGGWSYNAKIEHRLFKDRRYFLRLRLYYADVEGEGALMMY